MFTDDSGIQTLNFSNAQFLTQIVDFPTCFPNKSGQHVSLLHLFSILSRRSCRASQNFPFGNSDHFVVSY